MSDLEMSDVKSCFSLSLYNTNESLNYECESEQEEGEQHTSEYWGHQFPEYNFLRLLTETEGSLVWLGIHQTSQQPIAIKITQKILSECSVKIYQQKQMAFLQAHSLPSMAQIKRIQSNQNYFLIAMRYYEKGDLARYTKYFTNTKRKNDKSHLLFVIYTIKSILLVLEQFHSSGYIHRDLKLEIFLFDSHYKVYLSDFGLVAKQMEMDASLCGTIQYMAPERLSKFRGQQPLRRSSDVWAVGIILYELFTGKTPFRGQQAEEVLEYIYEGYLLYGKDIPTQAISLIQSMLEINPNKRASITKILQHPFLQHQLDELNIFQIIQSIT